MDSGTQNVADLSSQLTAEQNVAASSSELALAPEQNGPASSAQPTREPNGSPLTPEMKKQLLAILMCVMVVVVECVTTSPIFNYGLAAYVHQIQLLTQSCMLACGDEEFGSEYEEVTSDSEMEECGSEVQESDSEMQESDSEYEMETSDSEREMSDSAPESEMGSCN